MFNASYCLPYVPSQVRHARQQLRGEEGGLALLLVFRVESARKNKCLGIPWYMKEENGERSSCESKDRVVNCIEPRQPQLQSDETRIIT